MSELSPTEVTLPEPPRRDPWTVWSTMASAMLHVGMLVFFLWQPPPDHADAAPPPAIDVELVPPPEAVSDGEPPVKEREQAASSATAPPAETTSAEPQPPANPAAPAFVTEMSRPEIPPGAAAPATASEAPIPASEPVAGPETSVNIAPIPLSRSQVRGLTTPASTPDEVIVAVRADAEEMAEGTAPPASSVEPNIETLELGALRSARRFYLEAMLSVPSMARARAMLQALPPEKRLAQTCNIEALAQIGNAGEGFAPDIVMAEAYAKPETAGTRVAASGAIFRSGERWYGLAFDCRLSDDLTSVAAFSYRLGADVTDAVLARLNKN